MPTYLYHYTTKVQVLYGPPEKPTVRPVNSPRGNHYDEYAVPRRELFAAPTTAPWMREVSK